MRQFRGYMLALGGVLVAAVAMAIGFNLGRAEPANRALVLPEGEPWPPFVMIYRETWPVTGGSWRVRLEYRDERTFCSTELERPEPPLPADQGGAGRPRIPDPPTRTPLTCEERAARARAAPPGTPLEAPARWLIPSRIPPIAYRARQEVAPAADGLATAQLDIPYRTHEGAPLKVSREEVTYRLSDGIPIRFVEHVDGEVVHLIEVVELRFE